MNIEWSDEAIHDLRRVTEFLIDDNPKYAYKIQQILLTAPEALREHPRRGKQLTDYTPHEIRRLIVRGYELRYAIEGDIIRVVHLWHGKEDR